MAGLARPIGLKRSPTLPHCRYDAYQRDRAASWCILLMESAREREAKFM